MKQEHFGRMSEVGSLLAATVDGRRCLDHIRQIGHFDRSLGSSGYHGSAQYVQDAFRQMQLESRLVTWPMDGSSVPWNWSVPRSWEPEAGVFRVVEPEQRTLVNFVDTPTCIHPWSASTPDEGVTAEIVHVGEGLTDDDYAGKDVRGKIVFADRGASWHVYVQAIEKRGALGYISDDILEIPGVKTREQFPDMVLWYTFYEREFATGEPIKGWGLSISPRMGDYLRGLLAQGPVTGYCRVIARTFDGVMENVLGSIEGEEEGEEEFLCMAHLDHYRPGAMDNASGCSVLLEAADSLRRLIDRGKIPRPRRSIRFLFGQEGHMSNVYPHQMGDRLEDIIGSWTVDTVGGTPDEVGGPLLFLRGSAASPSFLNDLGVTVLKESSTWYPGMGQPAWVDNGDVEGPVRMDQGVSMFKFGTVPYGIYSDNSCLAGWGVPAVGLVQWPSTIWHTQYDTADRLDAGELARCAWATASASYRVASAGPSEAISWAYDVAEASRKRLADLARRTRYALASTDQGQAEEALEECRDHLLHLADRDGQAIASCSTLVSRDDPGVRDEVDGHIRKLTERLAGQAEEYFTDLHQSLRLPSPDRRTLPEEGDGQEPILGKAPQRVQPGLINMKYQAIAFGPKYAGRDPLFMDRFAELMNLSDGSRTISEIARLVGYELGKLDPLLVGEMFESLHASGYVTLLEKPIPPAAMAEVPDDD